MVCTNAYNYMDRKLGPLVVMQKGSEMINTVDLSLKRGLANKGPNWNSLPPYVEIIGVDPGETTGWSYMSVHPDAFIYPKVKLLDNINIHTHGQVDCGSLKDADGRGPQRGVSNQGENAGINDILRLFRAYPGAFVVIEDFIPQQFNKERHFLSPVRIGKVLDWWLCTQGRNYTFQMPSEAKSTATDDRLKIWKGRSTSKNGLYHPGPLVHARDADRHVITWLRKAIGPGDKPKDTREFCWPHIFEKGRPYGPIANDVVHLPS